MTHAPTHSAIAVHKGRPAHLKLFLQSFNRALSRARRPEWELILIDYDETDYTEYLKESSWLFAPFVAPLPDGQPLNKAKALNEAFSISRGEYITILDIDCLMPHDFLASIERFIYTHAPTKLAHHVRWLDPQTSEQIRKEGLGIMDVTVFRKLDRFNRYCEEYEGRKTGCSQQTIKADAFDQLNGFDERYVGYGLEDVDFNIRAFDKLGPPVFHDSATIELAHLWHPRAEEWHNDETDKGNHALFAENKAAGFPVPPTPASWQGTAVEEPTKPDLLDFLMTMSNDETQPPKRKPCECSKREPTASGYGRTSDTASGWSKPPETVQTV